MNPYVISAYAVTLIALVGYALLLRRERQRLSPPGQNEKAVDSRPEPAV